MLCFLASRVPTSTIANLESTSWRPWYKVSEAGSISSSRICLGTGSNTTRYRSWVTCEEGFGRISVRVHRSSTPQRAILSRESPKPSSGSWVFGMCYTSKTDQCSMQLSSRTVCFNQVTCLCFLEFHREFGRLQRGIVQLLLPRGQWTPLSFASPWQMSSIPGRNRNHGRSCDGS